LIRNSLGEILKEYNGQLISKIFEDFENNPVLDEYFDFLIDKEIIDIDEATNFDIPKLKSTFDSLGVKHLQIRRIGNDCDFTTRFLAGLLDTRLKSIELILPFTDDYLEDTKLLKKINPKILLVYFFGSNAFKTVKEENLPIIILTKDSVQALNVEKSPNPKYFAVNIQLFTESQKHNAFYNRKLFI
jgi:hypothetical protein